MEDQKSPGPYGFPAIFYEEYWPTVGETMIKAATSLPEEISSSLKVLISKTQSFSTINNFRLISLCSIVYKIISKLLVSKIRLLLQKLISPNQSAFILGRWIAKIRHCSRNAS